MNLRKDHYRVLGLRLESPTLCEHTSVALAALCREEALAGPPARFLPEDLQTPVSKRRRLINKLIN